MTENAWPLVELRQYTLRPGMRDTMIDLFDRELVETQEDVGIRVAGQFRDESDPDRFVWLRAFRDIAARTAALRAFYLDGMPWRTHAPAARATMLDTTNARLLRPATAASAFRLTGQRPSIDAAELPKSRALAVIHHVAGDPAEFTGFFESRVRPALGLTPIGVYVTDPSPNDFTQLPIRTGPVLVWFALFPDTATRTTYLDTLEASPEWTETVLPDLNKRVSAPTEQLFLAPTSRSLLR
ncbi:NIPSNAP family protein [Nocardia sp. NPDC051832]|uniref:NIPSNAP family protein n=1 Tax=Nocardia sp. NPDC051832 TaxID=3155673 RepID=UPI0034463A68